MTGLADFHGLAHSLTQPPGWPSQPLTDWALAALPGAVAGIEAAKMPPLRWTSWPSRLQTVGRAHQGTWPEVCAWLTATSRQRRRAKDVVPGWSPGQFAGNRRRSVNTEALYALVLDCDDCGDWDQLLVRLGAADLAYLAHRTPSHAAGGPCKWRLVLPLSRPVIGADHQLWRRAYGVARLALGALGRCWFDHATGDLARTWYVAAAVGDAPPREVVSRVDGRALNFGALLSRSPPARRLTPGNAKPIAARGAAGSPRERARRYLAAVPAPEPGARNSTTFRVAAQVFGLGLPETAVATELSAWNARSPRPLPDRELASVIGSAARARGADVRR